MPTPEQVLAAYDQTHKTSAKLVWQTVAASLAEALREALKAAEPSEDHTPAQASEDRVVVHFGGRTVHWKLNATMTAMLLQSLVQSLGPAEEGDGA